MILSAGSATLISVISSYDTLVNNSLQYGSPMGITFYAPTGYTMTGVYVANNVIDLQSIHNFRSYGPYGFDRTAGTSS